MSKLMVLLKRKPGMATDELIHNYENNHAPLGIKYQIKMNPYVRHYLRLAPCPLDGSIIEAAYDVLTELWINDRQAYDDGMALMVGEEANQAIAEDERRFLDLAVSRLAFIEEHESALAVKAPDPANDIRCFVLLKRKPGTTMDEFIDYYENRHQHLGVKYGGTEMARYRRLFPRPAPSPLDGSVVEPAYDVATEVSFANRQTMARATQLISAPETLPIIEADEANFLDRSTRNPVFVESYGSILPWSPKTPEGEFVRRASP